MEYNSLSPEILGAFFKKIWGGTFFKSSFTILLTHSDFNFFTALFMSVYLLH